MDRGLTFIARVSGAPEGRPSPIHDSELNRTQNSIPLQPGVRRVAPHPGFPAIPPVKNRRSEISAGLLADRHELIARIEGEILPTAQKRTSR